MRILIRPLFLYFAKHITQKYEVTWGQNWRSKNCLFQGKIFWFNTSINDLQKLEYWQNFVKKTSKFLKLFINVVKKFFIANGRISKGQNLKALYYLWIKYIFCYISLFLNVKNHLGGASSSAKFKMRRWVFQMSPPSTSRNFYYHLEFYWLEK